MSYRNMTKPLVHKIGHGHWGFTCCIGSVWPSMRALQWAARHGFENVPWAAAMHTANAHVRVWHTLPTSRRPRVIEWGPPQ